MLVLLTGAAGVIRSNFVLDWLARCDELVVNFDKLTCACNLECSVCLRGDSGYAFGQGRPGHERRYAIDTTKLHRELVWRPNEIFQTGIRKTVQCYLNYSEWVQNVHNGAYQAWLKAHYGKAAA